ncbi:MAG TPA: hypothetical protein VIN71_05150 [Pseudomonadales bacterium]
MSAETLLLSDAASSQPPPGIDSAALALKPLQQQLLFLQQALYRSGRRLLVVIEGTDAAGKGGVIRKLLRYLDARGYAVHLTGPPTAEELGQHYLQRFWRHLPGAGRMTVFDRSWYGRVLVERVDGLCSPDSWQRAYGEICQFEKLLQDDGVIVVKLFLHISHEQQRQRLLKRLQTPARRWKLGEADLRSYRQWHDYQQAFADMLANTASPVPWQLIPADDKHYARYRALETLIAILQPQLDMTGDWLPDEQLVQQAQALLATQPAGDR